MSRETTSAKIGDLLAPRDGRPLVYKITRVLRPGRAGQTVLAKIVAGLPRRHWEHSDVVYKLWLHDVVPAAAVAEAA